MAAPHKPAWPQPADAPAAARLAAQFAGLGGPAAKFAATPEGAACLAALGGNAPYLADLALTYPACLLAALREGPDHALSAILAKLGRLKPRLPRAELAQALRRAKATAALTIALADLGGHWTLPQITAALSALADAVLQATVNHLLLALPNPTPAAGSGFVALALGKLGAGELNYSSDIDLVLLYDSQNPAYGEEAQATMARLARDLVALLSQRDENGYVFRVDLRLRPDPAATPAVVSLLTALTYYESQGRTWERAAFSKARPVAGDLQLGAHFLTAIRPFIWRKHLDFAAIAEIHDMKRQIDAQQGKTGLLGFDVKLGRGGIREIEFMVQTLSLVWGGEIPGLRIPATLKALPALVRAGHLPGPVARELAAAYKQLRQVEHRLQMIADRQTHALPTTEDSLDAFIIFLGKPDFRISFPQLLARVHEHFAAFFDAGEALPGIDPGPAGKPPAAFAERLRALGFKDIQHVAERLRAWNSGTVPALRAERARAILEPLLPHLLASLGRQAEPDRAFLHFDTLISRQRAGVQLLSLFLHNTALLDRLANVLGASPALAEHLAQDAQALEALLTPPRFAAPLPVLRRRLREAATLEDALGLTRRLVRREEFHVSVATLEGRLDTDNAGRHRSSLAAAAISALLPLIITEHQARYGKLRGAGFAVVALGKTGGCEMLAGSDLDLMLIYDHSKQAPAPTQYFVRLAHALTAALTAQGPEGALYKVDMRLRPSGNQGPVAVSRAAFQRYHAAGSWTWERLALTRARVIAATPGFRDRVSSDILTALSRPEPADMIRTDTTAMLARLRAETPATGPWDVKHQPGGMMELAFIPEALQLIHGPANPSLFRANTADSLRSLATASHLTPTDAKTLITADHLWRTIQGIDRITGLRDTETNPPTARLAPLLRATNTTSLQHLQTTIATTATTVHTCFMRYIGGIGVL